MKKIKQAVSVLLTAVLLCGILSLSASAADPGTVTISSDFSTLSDGIYSYTIVSTTLGSTRGIALVPKGPVLWSLWAPKIIEIFDEKAINPSQVPAGITPTVTQSQKEADAYLAEIVYVLNGQANTMSASAINTVYVDANATLRDAIIVSKPTSFIAALRLRMIYSTKNAVFTSVKPYSVLTGITVAQEWKETVNDYSFSSNKTQVTITSSGTLSTYFTLFGFTYKSSKQITMTGKAVTKV